MAGGGYNLETGSLFAVEIIRSPLKGEFKAAYVLPVVALLAMLVLAGLYLTNMRLAFLVCMYIYELYESRKQYKLLMENQTDMIVKMLPNGQLTFASPSFCDTFGQSQELLRNRFLTELFPEDNREKIAQHIESVQEPPFAGYFETLAETTRGERWQAWLNTGVVDEQGAVNSVVAVGRDITERKEMEERLRQSEKMEAVGLLAGGVAHDFNNQLTGIMGYTEILRQRCEHDPQAVELADHILVGARRSAELTHQLLAYTRKDKGLKIPLNLHDILHEVITLLRHTIDRKIEIKSRLQSARSTIQGDPTQLQNVFLNLGINARDAMPNGGELLFASDIQTIEQHDTLTDYLCIRVRDTGIGMDEKTRRRIFDPFFLPPNRATKEQAWGWPRYTVSFIAITATSGSRANLETVPVSASCCP